MWKGMGLFLWKNHFLKWWGWLKLDWGSYIISITKTASKKIRALIRSMTFLTIQSYLEYCYHVWAGALSCYLNLLDKLQKRIFKILSPSLADSFEPMAHYWNIASLSFFYRYYFGRCSFELSQLVPFPYSRW